MISSFAWAYSVGVKDGTTRAGTPYKSTIHPGGGKDFDGADGATVSDMPDRNAIARTPQPDAEPGLLLRLKERLRLLDKVRTVVFRSFGTPDALHLRGRVIERKGLEGTEEESSTWQNVVNTVRRLNSDEIPGALLRAHLHGRTWDTRSDHEGFFVFDIDPAQDLEPGWHDVEIELVDSLGEPDRTREHVPVLVPAPDAEFAVVSDLDDTVIKTKSTDTLQQIAIVFGKGAHTRTPFRGIAALYRALQLGADDRGRNPMFYVSKSGWNLYDLFTEFMDANDIPLGPLFLTDLRVVDDPSPVVGSQSHKFESIDELIRVYPELPFVLLGDSGMRDPELYLNLAQAHPGRVKAVYIHDVSGAERDDHVDEIGRELEALGVEFARIADAQDVAHHAASVGLISERGRCEVDAAFAASPD